MPEALLVVEAFGTGGGGTDKCGVEGEPGEKFVGVTLPSKGVEDNVPGRVDLDNSDPDGRAMFSAGGGG